MTVVVGLGIQKKNIGPMAKLCIEKNGTMGNEGNLCGKFASEKGVDVESGPPDAAGLAVQAERRKLLCCCF